MGDASLAETPTASPSTGCRPAPARQPLKFADASAYHVPIRTRQADAPDRCVPGLNNKTTKGSAMGGPLPIREVASGLGISDDHVLPFGNDKAKIRLEARARIAESTAS